MGITTAKTKELLFGGALPDVTTANAAAWPISVPCHGALWIAVQ